MLKTIEINPKDIPKASVIWLHGLGASGHDFVDIIPELQLSPDLGVRFVFPHAPIRPVQYAGNAKLRAWFDIVALDRSVKEDERGIKESAELINQLIDNELARKIPSGKIVLAGFSQGGAMALQCGLRRAEALAGVLVLSSWLPLIDTVKLERSQASLQTSILMMHGMVDPVVPLNWAEESYEYLKKIGHNVTMSVYPMQHTVCLEEIAAIGVWLRNLLSV